MKQEFQQERLYLLLSGDKDMKLKKIIFIFILFLYSFCWAFFERRDSSARLASFGNSSSASADEVSALFDNPAGLSFLKSLNISLATYEFFPQLNLPEPLTCFHLSGALPFHPFGILGVGFRSFGLPLYHEKETLISYAFQLKRKFSAGLSIKWLSIDIKDEEKLSFYDTFGIDIATIIKINEQLKFGAVFKNIIAPVILNSSDNISKVAEIGLGWTPLKGVFFTVSAELDPLEPNGRFGLKGGNEWRLWDFLYIRTGFDTKRPAVTTGFGLHYRWIVFDYALVFSPVCYDQSIFNISFDLSESPRTVFAESSKKSKKRLTLEDLGPEKEYAGEKLNINTATVEELQSLPRIGKKIATRIVEYREKYGPFEKKEDIMKVSGIGIKTYSRFREFITVGTQQKEQDIQKETEKNINNITLKELIELKVPPLLAVRIIKFRDEKKVLKSFEDLKNAPDLTKEDLSIIKPLIEHLFK